MTLIEIPDEQAAALRQKAALQGLSLKDWLAKLAEVETPRKPLKTGYGILAKYGPAPSAEDIAENRQDMFRNFARDDFLDGRRYRGYSHRVAEVMRKVPRSSVPDMPDRMIAATATHLGVPAISGDSYIRASAVQTIW